MRHGSLFSGIGGFDLAAEWMGWQNVFHCEWMPFPRQVLDYYWPNADSHINICTTDFKKYEKSIEIISGGFPCQPFSLAGKRKGKNDERYLWKEMHRAICEIKPKFVVAENVYGITNIDGGMVFEQVCIDLEAEGYIVQPFIIPACAKNAPHRRDRCFFIAYTHFGRLERSTEIEWNGINVERTSNIGDVTNSNGYGFDKCNFKHEIKPSTGQLNAFGNFNALHNEKGVIDNADVNGRKKRINTANKEITNGNGVKESNARHIKLPNWENFPTESPICGGNDGLPTKLDGITFPKWRQESIKGYGNAVVPQVAYELFKVIEKLNKSL